MASTAALFVGFGVMAGSIGFYLGNATTLAQQWHFTMVTFSTYPATLFQGAVKLLLFTAVPALFINHYPVQALRALSLPAIMIVGAFVLPEGILGMIDASTTRRPSIPLTRSSSSTTASARGVAGRSRHQVCSRNLRGQTGARYNTVSSGGQ